MNPCLLIRENHEIYVPRKFTVCDIFKFDTQVRVAGAKHSWSPLFCDNEGDLIIYTQRLCLDSKETKFKLNDG